MDEVKEKGVGEEVRCSRQMAHFSPGGAECGIGAVERVSV